MLIKSWYINQILDENVLVSCRDVRSLSIFCADIFTGKNYNIFLSSLNENRECLSVYCITKR